TLDLLSRRPTRGSVALRKASSDVKRRGAFPVKDANPRKYKERPGHGHGCYRAPECGRLPELIAPGADDGGQGKIFIRLMGGLDQIIITSNPTAAIPTIRKANAAPSYSGPN